MAELIDREATYEVLTSFYHHKTDIQHNALREALNKVPSVQPNLQPTCNQLATDYISRQAAIMAVLYGPLGATTIYGRTEQGMTAQKETVQAIRMLPSVEAEPVRHGHWMLYENQNQDDVNNGNYLYVCSNCKHSDIHARTVDVPYCWHCGALMDEVAQ